ncbi:hypothetical protein MXAN_2182 [Myxococcus xanthus DK 1622]|uniref:Uncharacterized protein n=1 Tax=Myxococcus xanthus (strain DK1622) TaxID=246197 RepID=Q1DAB9_MYXXD|nr:hypothetical protein MXAN_2182 [Myxococcus xanthus DK 1622]
MSRPCSAAEAPAFNATRGRARRPRVAPEVAPESEAAQARVASAIQRAASAASQPLSPAPHAALASRSTQPRSSTQAASSTHVRGSMGDRATVSRNARASARNVTTYEDSTGVSGARSRWCGPTTPDPGRASRRELFDRRRVRNADGWDVQDIILLQAGPHDDLVGRFIEHGGTPIDDEVLVVGIGHVAGHELASRRAPGDGKAVAVTDVPVQLHAGATDAAGVGRQRAPGDEHLVALGGDLGRDVVRARGGDGDAAGVQDVRRPVLHSGAVDVGGAIACVAPGDEEALLRRRHRREVLIARRSGDDEAVRVEHRARAPDSRGEDVLAAEARVRPCRQVPVMGPGHRDAIGVDGGQLVGDEDLLDVEARLRRVQGDAADRASGGSAEANPRHQALALVAGDARGARGLVVGGGKERDRRAVQCPVPVDTRQEDGGVSGPDDEELPAIERGRMVVGVGSKPGVEGDGIRVQQPAILRDARGVEAAGAAVGPGHEELVSVLGHLGIRREGRCRPVRVGPLAPRTMKPGLDVLSRRGVAFEHLRFTATRQRE